MTRRLLQRLRPDRRGVTAIEFAFVAPVLALMLMGFCDILYQSYLQAMLTGAMQKAGRDSSIQGNGARANQIDGQVMGWVRSINPSATYVSSRKNYAEFGQVRPEQFDDNNGNGSYDQPSECFTDVNGNSSWDADPGGSGQGGANDVVVYKVTVTYPRLFPLFGMLGWSANQQIASTTILKNQPWAAQNRYATRRICP